MGPLRKQTTWKLRPRRLGASTCLQPCAPRLAEAAMPPAAAVQASARAPRRPHGRTTRSAVAAVVRSETSFRSGEMLTVWAPLPREQRAVVGCEQILDYLSSKIARDAECHRRLLGVQVNMYRSVKRSAISCHSHA